MSDPRVIDRQPTGASIGRGGGIETQTRTISDLVDDYGFLRNVMADLVDGTKHLHHLVDARHSDGLDAELRVGASERAKQPLEALLSELSDLGFSWRDIARVAGISVPALRKWRLGGAATGENRYKVALLLSLCETARSRYHIADVAGWLETPLHPNAPVTGLDIVAEGRFDLVLRLARDQGSDPEAVLDEFELDWRERYATPVEAFTGPDGMPGLRLTDS